MIYKKLEEKYFDALELRENECTYIKVSLFIGMLICIPVAFILDIILFPFFIFSAIIAILKGE